MSRNNTELLASLNTAMLERLNDPKNISKGSFPQEILEIAGLLKKEIIELDNELTALAVDYDKIRYECADVAVCLSFLTKRCDNEINNG